MSAFLWLAFATALCLGGCAQMQVNQRLKEYKQSLDPMVGRATREEVALKFGMPTRKQQLGSLEMWEYHKSFGIRGGGSAYSPSAYNSYANASSHEVYDSVTFTFDAAGVLKGWQAYAQR